MSIEPHLAEPVRIPHAPDPHAGHAHRHDHGHGENTHTHHHHAHAPHAHAAVVAPPRRFSLMALSSLARLLLAAPAIALLWLLTFWALAHG